MKIQVYGLGCANCSILVEIVKEVIEETGVDAEVIKVEDMIQIIEAGILATPGLAIDGRVKSMGRVPSKEEIKNWITGQK